MINLHAAGHAAAGPRPGPAAASAWQLSDWEAPGVTWSRDHFQVAALPTLLMNFKTIEVEVDNLIPVHFPSPKSDRPKLTLRFECSS